MRSKKSNRPSDQDVKTFLDERFRKYNKQSFIADDPICIPHRYDSLQDIEIAGLWTALLSWGLRKTIIKKAGQLFDMMGNEPHRFILEGNDNEKQQLMRFVHRTFQPTDTAYFLDFFKRYYSEHATLEDAFTSSLNPEEPNVRDMLAGFHERFFDSDWAPKRTRKHVATPARGASCKRLNMFLRWMVRDDDSGVDFGVWKGISPSLLMIPLDVHVHRVATALDLLDRKAADWKAVEQLTERLREFDPEDPVKYDYALFGAGVLEDGSVFLDT
jgi:uncharacterized protein (TIGR02757 family)